MEGEAHYLLGLTLVRLGRDDEAYAAFAKAAWLDAWLAAASLQLAIIDARHGRHDAALTRVRATLTARPDQLQARDLEVVLLRRLGHDAEATSRLQATLELDPLDAWALQLAGHLETTSGPQEAQTLIDVGLEHARIGEYRAAAELFERARLADAVRPLGQTACGVLADYHAAAALEGAGDHAAAAAARARARTRGSDLELRIAARRRPGPRSGADRRPDGPDCGSAARPLAVRARPAAAGHRAVDRFGCGRPGRSGGVAQSGRRRLQSSTRRRARRGRRTNGPSPWRRPMPGSGTRVTSCSNASARQQSSD